MNMLKNDEDEKKMRDKNEPIPVIEPKQQIPETKNLVKWSWN